MVNFNGISQCVLHLGMHRTGTTLFQEFMYVRRDAAAKHKIKFIEIDECRSHGFLSGITYSAKVTDVKQRPDFRVKAELENYALNGWRVVVSDENISGSMEDCVINRKLYPNFSTKVCRLGASVDFFDTVYISIRPEDDWWLSCLAFLRQRDFRVSNYEMLASSVVNSKRTWVDLVDEIIEIFPNAKIVVRDFCYQIANPKRQMKDVTAWPEIRSIKNMPTKKSNGSSNGKKMLFLEDDQHLFTAEQIAYLKNRYAKDLSLIAQNLKVHGKGKMLIKRPN